MTSRGELAEVWEAVKERRGWLGEVWDRRKNGERYPSWLSVSAVTDRQGEVRRFIALFSDITAAKKTEEQLYYMAHYDSLTGLANRRHFQDTLARAISQARRSAELLGVMFIDLDSFKLVNDNLGHRIGDQFLCETATRIKGCVRDSDFVARMGGDEFTVVLNDVKGVDNAATIAQKILKRAATPVVIEGHEVFVTASVGIALVEDGMADPETVVRRADSAMNRVKERGRNSFEFYSQETSDLAEERLLLQPRIRRGLDAGEFVPYYQPQINISSGKLVGFEALARWHTPDKGLLGPGLFIPAAERTGQICEIGAAMLRQVCRQASLWRARGLKPPTVSVNVSAYHLRRPDFFPLLQGIIEETRLPPGSLELELTESALFEDNSVTIAKLEKVRSLGVSLAIDDFGTKYSSLAYLRRLPVDRLKIDGSFVRDIVDNPSSLEITSAIVSMGKSLKLGVVAEGVETELQARLLRDIGCTCVQGFLYGKAVPAEEAVYLIRSGTASAASCAA